MNGERLRQAREVSGLTQQELAERVGLVQSAIAQMEASQFDPTAAAAQALAVHTGFDLNYLKRPEPPVEFPEGTLLYRSKAKVSPRDKTKARRYAQLFFEMVLELKSAFRAIPVTIPRLNTTPVEAARITRSQLGLSPDTPIKNITSLLERAGVLVLRVPLEVDGLDGFSAWVGRDREVPTICMVGESVAYRGRYTISEELGHLVLHTPLRVPTDQAESEVKDFVGEFVLPEDAMRREMASSVTLSSLAAMRHKWGASIQFLAARSRQLEITSPNQYRYLMQQVSKSGWRTKKREPGDEKIITEKPQLVLKLLESVYGAPPDLARMRRELGIPLPLIRGLLHAQNGSSHKPSPVLTMAQR